MKYLSLDLETTDLTPGQILEIGAVIGGTDDFVTPVSELPRFHTFVQHDRIEGDPVALAMNARCLRAIANGEGASPSDAIYNLGQFLYEHFGRNHTLPRGSVTVAGKNPWGLDIPFLEATDVPFSKAIVEGFHHRALDPAPYFLETFDDKVPSSQTCMERAGLKGEVAHTAIEDAEMVVKLVRIGLARVHNLEYNL